ncbi:hypothetical protein [Sediminicoccus sp. KRV36]|uniref:hypothetical protein n=1 Tax=Sediminicoccus sp. KRV36 TaxID=3133721 RepID=UPI0020107201|nr:hypothetical protein [Sediminicoccus rosea]UPY37350.1 hypothetical protein LHU95_01285 [Sediminicoccus rosea]
MIWEVAVPEIETGDVLYFSSGVGHIGMAYSASHIIHAQMSGDFHKSSNDQFDQKKGVALPSMSNTPGTLVFRPPWGTLSAAEVTARKEELQRVADAIAAGATYGAYRAIRLLIGSSEFGPEAFGRLQKYRDRYLANKGTPENFKVKGKEVIKTVTCSEAVIITYQLTFPLREKPFFIGLDGAHAMPGTLRDWLRASPWTLVT